MPDVFKRKDLFKLKYCLFVYNGATLERAELGARPYWSSQTWRHDVFAGSDDLTAFVHPWRRRRRRRGRPVLCLGSRLPVCLSVCLLEACTDSLSICSLLISRNPCVPRERYMWHGADVRVTRNCQQARFQVEEGHSSAPHDDSPTFWDFILWRTDIDIHVVSRTNKYEGAAPQKSSRDATCCQWPKIL